MAALTKDRKTRTKAGGTLRHNLGDLAANAIIFLGAVIAKTAAGFIVPATDAAALVVIGISEESVDNTGGADGAKTCSYITGIAAELNNAGGAVVQAGKHAMCYVADDNSVTSAAVAVNDVVVGQVQEFTAALVWVFIDEAVNASYALDAPVTGAAVDVVANAAVSPASSVGGIPVVIPINVPESATATQIFKTTQKIEIIDVVVIKDGNGAGNTIQVTDGADAAISNAIAAAVDKTVTRAGTLDKAKRVLAAGATFKVVGTNAAGLLAAQVFIYAIVRA